jgi:hypothetical protein
VKRTAKREPASGRHPAPRELFDAFLAALDPRGESEHSVAIQFALACSPDPRFLEFLERLYQPRYQRWSLAAIAKSCDISLGEFVSFWRNAQVERAIAIVHRASPAVAHSIVSNALGREVPCERCDGLGWVDIVGIAARVPSELIPGYLGRVAGHPVDHRQCPKCDGSGKMREPGDPHACDRVLEIAGLIGKRHAVQQVVTYNFNRAVETLNPMTFDAEGSD